MISATRQHRIRVIHGKLSSGVCGVTIPNQFKDWLNTFVTIKESGNCLILESGAIPSALTTIQLKSQITIVEKIKI